MSPELEEAIKLFQKLQDATKEMQKLGGEMSAAVAKIPASELPAFHKSMSDYLAQITKV